MIYLEIPVQVASLEAVSVSVSRSIQLYYLKNTLHSNQHSHYTKYNSLRVSLLKEMSHKSNL